MAGGLILVFEYYQEHSTLAPENTEKIERVLVKNKRVFGFLSLAVAALHFLLPRALFL
jgi:hypothetical protein